MKIKNIELFTYTAGWREWSFLKIGTDQNLVGWAECTDTFKNLNGFIGILKDFEDLILEEDPLNIERIIWKLQTKSRSNLGSLIQRVISAVENTLSPEIFLRAEAARQWLALTAPCPPRV